MRPKSLSLTLGLGRPWLAIFCLVCVEAVGAQDRHVRVINNTSRRIVSFYASNVSESAWQEDLLGTGTVVEPGNSLDINIDNGTGYCRYDIKVVFSDGSELTRTNVDVCRVETWTINENEAFSGTKTPLTSSGAKTGLTGSSGKTGSTGSSAKTGSTGSGAKNWSDDQLQQVLDKLPLGQVVFHHPNEMQLRKPDGVQVRISQDLQRDLTLGLSQRGIIERDLIKTSTTIKVRLSGDPYFDVKALNDEEQLVTEKGYTEWSFTVLPLKEGHWPLHLLITAIIRTPFGTEKVKDYPVKDEIVEVRVTAFNAVLFFVGDNWQWLVTAILIPLGVWLWKERTGTKKKKRSSATHHS